MYSMRFALVLAACISSAWAQNTPSQPNADAAQASTATARPVSAMGRLRSARKIYLQERGRGNHIPFEIINSAFGSWARYIMVDKPEDAEVIVEIWGPDEVTSLSVEGPMSAYTLRSQRSKPQFSW
jgi:hypothetical protein